MKTIPQTIDTFRQRARRLLGAASLLLLFAVAPAAHAQWEVNDADANATLQQIRKDTQSANTALGTPQDGGGHSMNNNLDAINRKLVIGTYDASQPGPRVADPNPALPAAGGTALDDGTACKTVAQPQQETCNQIVTIQNAQYQYMLTMYANSKVRDDMLRTLLKERESISADDPNQYGRLENNTNKLTALYNLIALDQQQMQSVNYAYDANLRYLRATQTLGAVSAATGKKKMDLGTLSIPGLGDIDVGSAIAGLATGAALKTALTAVQTSEPSGMQTLTIGKTDGW